MKFSRRFSLLLITFTISLSHAIEQRGFIPRPKTSGSDSVSSIGDSTTGSSGYGGLGRPKQEDSEDYHDSSKDKTEIPDVQLPDDSSGAVNSNVNGGSRTSTGNRNGTLVSMWVCCEGRAVLDVRTDLWQDDDSGTDYVDEVVDSEQVKSRDEHFVDWCDYVGCGSSSYALDGLQFILITSILTSLNVGH